MKAGSMRTRTPIEAQIQVHYQAYTKWRKLAGLKSAENAHGESDWAATWVPATDTGPALLHTGSLEESVKLWRPDVLELGRTNTGHCLDVVSPVWC